MSEINSRAPNSGKLYLPISFFSSSSPTSYDDPFKVVATSDFDGDLVSIVGMQWHFDTV